MMPDQEFAVKQRLCDELRQEKERAVGARQELLKQLKERFGCSNGKEVKAVDARLAKEEAGAQQDVEEAEAAFLAALKAAGRDPSTLGPLA